MVYKGISGMERKTHTKPADQRGMASIVITMVTMVVISLIVIGFATVSRREQRQSLDQLLSSQAFYAAESGVEDARAIIKSAVAAGQPIAAKDDCAANNPGGTYPTGDQTIVDSQYETSYTCLKVDPGPTSVLFDGVGQNSVVVPVTTDQPLTSLRVTWKPSTAPSGSPNVCPVSSVRSFSSQTNWTCGYGVLKADIVPTDGAITRAGLGAGLANGIFVPVRGGGVGQLSYAAARGGANVTDANCDTAGYTQCTATFTNIPGGVRSLSLRVTSMYRASDIQIEGFVGGNAQEIKGVQAIVDSTGRASDILRRIQVRLPLIQTGGKLPGYAISSNGAICKRFNITPNYFAVPGDIVDPDTDNDMCTIRSSGTP